MNSTETGLLRGVQAVGGIAGGALVGTLARRTDPSRLLGWAGRCWCSPRRRP
ncbi:hypothetical protein OG479_00440 [Streptomyces subrutilus]|nr:hypothetical protein OG479_00440 [Streptomyces subrutilus]